MVNPTKIGRTGPKIVLNPAHPNDNAFSNICMAQHEDDSKPRRDHHAIVSAMSIMYSLILWYKSRAKL